MQSTLLCICAAQCNVYMYSVEAVVVTILSQNYALFGARFTGLKAYRYIVMCVYSVEIFVITILSQNYALFGAPFTGLKAK